MLHVKKEKIDLSEKTVQRILQKLKIKFIYLLAYRSLPESDFEQNNIPCFKVGMF